MFLNLQEFVLLILLHPNKCLAIAFWYITRRRMRALIRLRNAIATLPFAYARWRARCARVDRDTLSAAASVFGQSMRDEDSQSITVHIHIPEIVSVEDLAKAVASVRCQVWPHWRLLMTVQDGAAHVLPEDARITVLAGTHVSHAAGLRAALDAANTEYLVSLRPDCRLPESALVAYAAWLAVRQGTGRPILYGDQDEIDRRGRRRLPWFKPDWDPEMFLAQDYLSASCALPIAAARTAIADLAETGDGVAVYGLLLEMALRADCGVEHIYRITVSTPPNFWSRLSPDRIALLANACGIEAQAGPFGTASICWPLPEVPPLVSVIIPTRDHVELLRTCVEGVLVRTRYPNLEIIILDNGSVEPESLAFFIEIAKNTRVRVISWHHPYNYSAINNFAASMASGDYLCLLNNDIEIIDSDWLSELMRYAVRPGAGAVGARLLYPDFSIQHAGIVVGMGNAAGHAHRGLPKGSAGYFANALVAHGATAVTAACLVVRRSLFEVVGGLDEDDLRIAYNDVDLCLKLRQAGAQNYYVPSAVLVHHESKSRGLDTSPEHLARYLSELETLQGRWDTKRFLDPAHHPMLDRESETYKPAFRPPPKVHPLLPDAEVQRSIPAVAPCDK